MLRLSGRFSTKRPTGLEGGPRGPERPNCSGRQIHQKRNQ